MKILKQTNDRLIIEHRPILFTGLFAAVSLATFGWGLSDLFTGGPDGWIKIIVSAIFMAATLFLVERARLTLDGRTGQAEYRRISVFGVAHHLYTLGEISRFEIETSASTDGDTHRLVMIVSGGQAKGRYPITKSYYSWLDQSIVYTLNGWLDRQKGRSDPSAL